MKRITFLLLLATTIAAVVASSAPISDYAP
jgi:hypothetical protein